MYNNYTPLQQRQLALQEYSNTQSTYLLVCASARSTALKATLTDQLHRKFRLVERLEGELTASVDGVLLAAEDVELMSTALMFFAKALQDGADYAVCNAVFGFGGATALYQSQPLQAQNRCAVVSRTLLERCRAAAHDPENVPELLALAAQLCTKPTLIPAGPAPLRARHLRRGCVFGPRQTCLYYEPCAGYDRRTHRAGECRAGAAQHGV